MPPRLMLLLLLPYHVLPPVAVLAGAAAGREMPLLSLILLALATGMFLYVGAFEVVCEEFAQHIIGSTTSKQAVVVKGAAETEGMGENRHHAVDAEARMGNQAAAKAPEWYPSKGLKFFMFLLGSGCLLGLTAALPRHSH